MSLFSKPCQLLLLHQSSEADHSTCSLPSMQSSTQQPQQSELQSNMQLNQVICNPYQNISTVLSVKLLPSEDLFQSVPLCLLAPLKPIISTLSIKPIIKTRHVQCTRYVDIDYPKRLGNRAVWTSMFSSLSFRSVLSVRGLHCPSHATRGKTMITRSVARKISAQQTVSRPLRSLRNLSSNSKVSEPVVDW